MPALVSCKLDWRIEDGQPSGGSALVTAESFSCAAGLTRLVLKGHGGLQLAPRCFGGLSLLEELCIEDCGLTAVPAAALAGVGRTLRRLDLSRNELQLSPACFSGCSVLEELSLDHCGLTAVPAGSFAGLERTLRRLDLGDNDGLQLAPRCLSGLLLLEDIDIGGCGLTAVPAALAGVGRALRRLNLGRNDNLEINKAGSDILLGMPVLKSLHYKSFVWADTLVDALKVWQGRQPQSSQPAS